METRRHVHGSPVAEFPGDLDHTTEQVVIVDGNGVILAVNEAWRAFACENGGNDASVSVGVNYIAVCEAAAAGGDTDALAIAIMIRNVAAGLGEASSRRYTCHAPDLERWFEVVIRAIPGDGPRRIMVAHRNVTSWHRVELQLYLDRQVLASVPQAVVAFDLEGRLLHCNALARKLCGHGDGELIGHRVEKVLLPLTAVPTLAEVTDAAERQLRWVREFEVIDHAGLRTPIRITYSPIRDRFGTLTGAIGLLEDIASERAVTHATHLASRVYEAIGEAVLIVDREFRPLATNVAFERLSERAQHGILQTPLSALLPDLRDKRFASELLEGLERTGQWQGRVRLRAGSGRKHQVWLSVETAYDEHDQVAHRIGMFSVLTPQKLRSAIARGQANVDALTGLANRRIFYDRLQHCLDMAKRHGSRLALMFIDLDHFKEINDSAGHLTGDLVLRETAVRLTGCVRKIDTVARLGGDEFTIILGELDDTGSIERVAEATLQALRAPFEVANRGLRISASIGIAVYPADAADVDTLIANADQAMYSAKAHGRNRMAFYSTQMHHAAAARKRLADDLRAALHTNELYLVYQPIADIDSGRFIHAEALVRWQHPVLGAIGPAEFIPIAGETGLIAEISEWICDEACKQAAICRALVGSNFKISVNLSAVQLRENSNTAGREAVLLHAARAGLVLEVSGAVLTQAYSEQSRLVQTLVKSGAQFAIDDFGVSPATLSHLKHFRLAYLKIAQSLVARLAHDSDALAMCNAIIAMAIKLDITVVAQGVETEAQRTLLRLAGCERAQGFLFGMPMTGALLETHLRNQAC